MTPSPGVAAGNVSILLRPRQAGAECPELARSALIGGRFHRRPGHRRPAPGGGPGGVRQVVVGRGSRFPAGNFEVIASRHGQLMPRYRVAVPAERRTRTPHSYDLNVTQMSPCVTSGAFGSPG